MTTVGIDLIITTPGFLLPGKCAVKSAVLSSESQITAIAPRLPVFHPSQVRRGEQSLASEAFLASIGEEIDAACRILYRNDRSRLKVFLHYLSVIFHCLWLESADKLLTC